MNDVLVTTDLPDPDPTLAADGAAWERRAIRSRWWFERVGPEGALSHLGEHRAMVERERRQAERVAAQREGR